MRAYDDHKPVARTEGILSRLVGDELVLLDTATDETHLLNPEMRRIWELCDGTNTAGDIAADLGTDLGADAVTLVRVALSDLLSARLVSGAQPLVTRRRALKAAGAAALALPVVLSLSTAPALAQTVCFDGDCTNHPSLANPCAGCTAPGTGTVCCASGPNINKCKNNC